MRSELLLRMQDVIVMQANRAPIAVVDHLEAAGTLVEILPRWRPETFRFRFHRRD